MGEEEKKPEEKKAEAPKAEDGKKEEKQEPKKVEAAAESGGGEGQKKDGGEAKGEAAPPPPPPPEEIVMRVYMHCEGCARKVKRSLKGFEGVEEVTTDCRSHKVVVKGKKAAEDPMKVVERVQKKSGRKVDLLTPIPPPKPKPEEKKEEEKPKVEEKKEEPPAVITVVLKVHMHCEACGQEIKKRILKMKGVQSAEPDLKNSQVTVKGVFEPPKLVEQVYKKTGKHAAVVKQDPPEKPPEPEKKAEEAKAEEKKPEDAKEKKEGGGGAPEAGGGAAESGGGAAEGGEGKVELKRNEYYYYYPRYGVEYNVYPPQIFSDENPNACAVM